MKDDERHCPECGEELPVKARSCRCGWGRRKPRIQETDDDPLRNQCAYTADSLRCCYPGTTGAATNGTGPRYCRWHFSCDDPAFGARIVQESQTYRPEDDNASFQSEVYESSLRKCGLVRAAGETVEQFAQRCRTWVLSNLNHVGRPLPYDPSKSYAEDPQTMNDE